MSEGYLYGGYIVKPIKHISDTVEWVLSLGYLWVIYGLSLGYLWVLSLGFLSAGLLLFSV